MEVVTRIDRLEDALVRLAEAQSRTESRLEELAAAQVRTESRLEELAAAQQNLAAAQARTEGEIELLAAAQARTETALNRLAEAQARTESQLGALISWQKGEEDRRNGERYERDVVQLAPRLFAGGEGGTPEEGPVRRRLTAQLVPSPEEKLSNLDREGDPFLADLIWWKGERIAVVEVSIVVAEHDVRRAWERADTLRRAGASALGVVIGQNWAGGDGRGLAHQLSIAVFGDTPAPDDARTRAERRGIAWKVGDDVSDGFIAFRRLSA